MAFSQRGIGNPFIPVINDREFKMTLRHIGINVIHRSKVSATKCTVGWDDISGTHDPNCTACTGSSGYNYDERIVKVIFRRVRSHAMYNADDIITVAGINERADVEMYCDAHTGRNIYIDDLITMNRIYNDDYVEYTVVAKVPTYGSNQKVVFYKFRLFKSVKPDVISPPTFRKM